MADQSFDKLRNKTTQELRLKLEPAQQRWRGYAALHELKRDVAPGLPLCGQVDRTESSGVDHALDMELADGPPDVWIGFTVVILAVLRTHPIVVVTTTTSLA